ncbi:hypothetical protein B2M26_13090 [Ferroacidibacillus organovorans]|uniref:Major facilitator superfamily (MFS) profile domain-containing protein n=1 Tax=Ferroacidibacillus organovorans TaxID=1765683 RepID=A0A1V4EQ92_9BACL|nr:hypothetical protein B2M26_13090 [Ferroacidibacillus organovorans]
MGSVKFRILAYSLGNLGINLYTQAFATYAVFYYVDRLRVSAALIGLAMAIHGLANALFNPLIGYLSDRTQSRFGRRMPFMVIGILPFALAFFLVFHPQWAISFHANGPQSQSAAFFYFLFSVLTLDMLFVIVALNWTALFPEMYTTLKERAQASSWRQFFGLLGMILGVAMPPVIDSTLGYEAMAALFAGLGFVTFTVSLLGVRESPQAQSSANVPLLRALRLTFWNRAFLTYVGASFFVQLAFVFIISIMPFYTAYVLRATSAQTTLLLSTFFLIAIPCVYVWGTIARRIGAYRSMLASLFLFAAALLPFLFIRSYSAALIAILPLGAGVAGVLILLDVLLSDVIDDDEKRSGARREGMYYGVQGFVVRFGITIQALVLTQVLAHTGYVPQRMDQVPHAVLAMKLLLSVTPLCAILIGLLFLWRYPLHGTFQRVPANGRAGMHTGC